MSRILRAAPSEPGEGDTSRFKFADWGAARAQLETADQDACEIVAAAQREAARIREQARDQGRADALCEFTAAVEARVREELETLLPALGAAVSQIESAKSAWLARWEQSALGVALAIAGRVVRREISQFPDISLTLVRESLELASGADEVRLCLHPDDAELLQPHLHDLLAELGRLGKCKIAPDAGISRGGCRVETRSGTIDQQIESQLARIEQELR